MFMFVYIYVSHVNDVALPSIVPLVTLHFLHCCYCNSLHLSHE